MKRSNAKPPNTADTSMMVVDDDTRYSTSSLANSLSNRLIGMEPLRSRLYGFLSLLGFSVVLVGLRSLDSMEESVEGDIGDAIVDNGSGVGEDVSFVLVSVLFVPFSMGDDNVQ